jgi:putative colanic acid biosynthesis acetyltransferase WcaF
MGNPFRTWLLRLFGATTEGGLILPSCRILQPCKLTMGRGSAVGEQVEIYNYAEVNIGEMTVISQYCYLCTGTHDYTEPDMPLTWYPITIGSECWLAAGVFVAPGVTIGDGAVIGAKSVVTKDMPAWTVCAGNPCRPIKPRIVNRSALDLNKKANNEIDVSL